VWRHDQNVHILGQKVVALFRLHGIVAVGDLYFTLGADFLAPLLEQGLVALPAFFFQRVHGNAYAHRAGAFGSFAGVASGSFDAGGQQKRSQQQEEN
jgi:hypothetical protein